MTVQLSQIPALESRLLPDASTRNTADNSFRQYLDNEQKRLSLLFSPFAQVDFYSWFSYPDFSARAETAPDRVNILADIGPTPPEAAAGKHQNQQAGGKAEPAFGSPRPAGYYSGGQSQPVLQSLLRQTGWLTPNIEARPQLYLAQLQGKLLSKLDLQSLVDQILSRVKLVKEKGKVELTVGLRPKELGEVLLTLTARSGMISISIQAPDSARRLLEDELAELELALKKAKVRLAGIRIVDPKEVNKYA